MKQKLLIFFLIGIFIFLIDITFNEDSPNKITIYESELDSLINTWVTQVGREPTNDEIDGIIKQLIDEEILYREALKLGLDLQVLSWLVVEPAQLMFTLVFQLTGVL